MGRVEKRGASDRFEVEAYAFFERVRAKYLERAKQEPSRIAVIDASQSLAEVKQSIADTLKPYLQQNH